MRILAFFAASLQGVEAFRAAEITAIAELYNFHNRMRILDDPSGHRDALCLVDIEGATAEQDARRLASRSVLLHHVSEVFAVGCDLTHLVETLQGMDYQEVFEKYMGKGKRFKFQAEGWGKVYTQADKVAIYNTLGQCFPAASGIIDVARPETTFLIMIDHEKGGRAYFTRIIQDSCRKELLHRYRLPARPHIGTTSMLPELCFVMANLAKVKKGDVVYDTFCGTGSTLVSAGHFGAVCWGADRDGRTMRGEKSSIYGNFAHYGLRQGVGLIRLSSESNGAGWRLPREGLFHAILTDPPYGIREPSKKVDRKRCEDLLPSQKDTIISLPSEKYEQHDVETDLLTFAAKSLRIGGRLAYWHPTLTAFDLAEIPTHRIMRLVGVYGQSMNLRVSRQLIVMEKVEACLPTDRAMTPTVMRDLRALYFNTGPDATLARSQEEQIDAEGGSTAYERYLAKRQKKREAVIRFWGKEESKKDNQDALEAMD